MKYEKPEDGLRVTTPVYMGSKAAVAKMMQCPHDEYRDLGDWAPHEELQGVEMCMQMCASCNAQRAAVRGPEDKLREAFREGDEPQWDDPGDDDDDGA